MANPDEYTVGWICALQEEYEAACRMLDDEFEGPDVANENDNNTYVLGRIHEHNVVIGCLPHGRYGISSAATVAKDMIRSFPSLKFALMVGIGGGAPTPKRDIRLGDVVVSVPQGRLGGVIQYDFGKRLSRGRFQQTGQMNSPPEVLLGAIPEMQRRHNDPRKPDKLAEHIKIMDDMLEYQRPDEDRLYRANYKHQGGITCEKCLADGLEQRLPRVAKRAVNVHYGIIASANSVMKSSEVRDQLAQDPELKVLCFEMEAAGLMNNFPCLVIRGICDYSDSHKNDEWHKYAALAAAAYAREFLHVLKPRKIKILPSWAGRFENTLAALQKEVLTTSQKADTIIHHQENLKSDTILDWLSLVNYGPQQSDNFARRQPGTCTWFLNTKQFRTWLNISGKTLFCPGIPGAGKSILTSIVVDNLGSAFSNQNNIGIAYVYFDFGRQHEQTADKLLASLLKQLAENLPTFPESLKLLHEYHRNRRTRPSLEELSDTIQSTAKLYSKVFILIDALDECHIFEGNRQKFLERIFSLQAECGINIFATSRHIFDIVELFKGSLVLRVHAKDADVRKYLKHRVENTMSELPPSVRYDSILQADIINTICNSARGMFLLARLHLNSLVNKTSEKEVRSALKKLPNGSNAYDITYKEAMIRVEKQAASHQDLAKRVLSWITYSKRTLTVVELQHAIAIETKATRLEKESLPHIDTIISVCAGLVTMDIESGNIRLVHYTARQYFDKTRDSWFPKAEAHITDACVTYLSFDVFGSGPCQNIRDFKQRMISNPFYEYSTLYWAYHARKASYINEAVISFLESNEKVESAGQVIGGVYRCWRGFPRAGLHLAAWFGLDDAIRILIKRTPINQTDVFGRTTLSYAIERKHEHTVKMLLEMANFDINARDNFDRNPILLAASAGNEGIMKLLIDTGKADINVKATECSLTPLEIAVKKRHEGIVKLLLDTGRINGIETVFALAIAYADKRTIKLFLDAKKIDANGSYGNGHNTPLQMAVGYNENSVVQLLLDTNEADVNAINEYGESALGIAIKEENEEIVKLLLDTREIDVNAPNEYDETPFDLALISGHKGIINLLHEYCGMETNNGNGSCGVLQLVERRHWSD